MRLGVFLPATVLAVLDHQSVAFTSSPLAPALLHHDGAKMARDGGRASRSGGRDASLLAGKGHPSKKDACTVCFRQGCEASCLVGKCYMMYGDANKATWCTACASTMAETTNEMGREDVCSQAFNASLPGREVHSRWWYVHHEKSRHLDYALGPLRDKNSTSTATTAAKAAKVPFLAVAQSRAEAGRPRVHMYSDKQRLDPAQALALYSMVHKVARLLERQNVTYWAAGGTLLGAVRNRGIIPHDNDADFNVLRQAATVLNSAQFTALLARNGLRISASSSESPDSQWCVTEIDQASTSKAPKYYLDIFALDVDRKGRLQYADHHYRDSGFPRDVLGTLQEWPFGNSTVMAPGRAAAEAYLAGIYGPRWRTEAECRQTAHPCQLSGDRDWDVTGMAMPCGPVSDPK